MCRSGALRSVLARGAGLVKRGSGISLRFPSCCVAPPPGLMDAFNSFCSVIAAVTLRRNEHGGWGSWRGRGRVRGGGNAIMTCQASALFSILVFFFFFHTVLHSRLARPDPSDTTPPPHALQQHVHRGPLFTQPPPFFTAFSDVPRHVLCSGEDFACL